MRVFRTVRFQLTAATVCIVVCIYAASAIGIYGIVQKVVYASIDKRLQQIAQTLTVNTADKVFQRLPEGTYAFVKSASRVQTNADSETVLSLPPIPDVPPKRATERTVITQGGIPYRVFVAQSRVALRRANVGSIVMVATDVEKEQGVLDRLKTVLYIVGSIGVVVAGVAGFALAERFLRPIKSAWRRQQEFVADASHELRTPLSVIQSNLSVILEHTDEQVSDNLEWLDNAYSESRRMSKLLQDMLTLARGDAEAQPLQMTHVSATEIAKKVCDLFAPVFTAKSQGFSQEIEDHVMIHADEDRLHQLLVILLDNAAKYTPDYGTITLRLQKHRHSAVFQVEDSGMGISKRDLPRIFDRFYQVDASRSRDGRRGSGLGLAIAKWIVDAHQGKIDVSSTPQVGTIFTITFPMSPSSATS